MAELTALETFKLVTSSISCISPFNGDVNSLINFIHRIESLIPIFDPLENDYKIVILGLIKDKVIGNARRSLLTNRNANTWNELRTILITNHGENSSTDSLIDKIRTCRCDGTIDNFYQNLNNLLCRLNNAFLLQGENNANEIVSNQRIALNSFKYGLPEPVKSIIISRNPQTLKAAHEIIQENGYLNYTNNKHMQYTNTNFRRQNFSNINQNSFNNSNQNSNTFNQNNNPFNNVNQNRRQNFTNSGHSRFTQNSGNGHQNRIQFNRPNANNRPNFNNNQNFNNRFRNDHPEPMDISVNEIRTQENFQRSGRNSYPI